MTIHNLMNASPVASSDVEILVFAGINDRAVYIGKYEDSTPYIYNMEVREYSITGIDTRHYDPGRFYITSMTIYADVQ